MKRFLLLYLLLATSTCFANRIYVNQLATGANNGTSWANAYTLLQTGIGQARANDTVLVAEGVYKKPDYYGAYAYYLNAGTLLGGYPNTGNPTDADRDWVNHPTIIDGSPTFNSSDVLVIRRLTSTVIIDGVILTNASATAVIIEENAPVIFKNTLFRNNNKVALINNTQTSFTNCVFYNNGTVINNTVNANTNLYNCVFTNNMAGWEGLARNENASLGVYNCTFANNTGIPVYGTGSGATTITNCIMWGNKFSEWPNKEYTDFRAVNHLLQISHCLTQVYYDDNDNTMLMNQHPRFVNQRNPAGIDNKFFTADDGLQLTAPCSPALNFGNNAPLASILTDLLGNPRIYNGGTVDLGAYELQMAPLSHVNSVYVKSTTSGSTANGSSWATAFTSLQSALLYCADTIKIAAGTYLTPNSYVDSVFIVESGKVIMGGYPATGNPTDADRNPAIHHTILKGNYTTTYTGAYYPVIKAIHTKGNTVLDGIKVTNFATIGGTQAYAITVNLQSKIKILNCDFRIDTNTIVSPGLYIRDSSTAYIYNCTFNDGPAGSDNPPAVYCVDKSDVRFNKCAFQSNAYVNGLSITSSTVTLDSCTGWSNAAAVFINSNKAALTINNCLFRAYNNGSAFIYNTNNTTGTVNNSIFRNITGDYSIPAIYNDNSQLTFNKCLFDSSRLVFQNINQSAPVLNNCLSVHGRLMINRRSFPTVNNCTVVNTYVPPRSLDNLPRQELVINEDGSVFRANNTIFWSEKQVDNKRDITDGYNSSSILTHCLTQLYGTHGQNGNIVGKVPRFNRLDVILGPDGKLFTADDGLQLASCSPAVNAGNSSLSPVFATDVLDNPRIVQSAIDMGAYESQAAATSKGAYYVNRAATGTNDGSSWTNAYTDLQTALCNSCADTIRVAAGTYKPAAIRDSTFEINRPMALYGGYSATGNERDVVKYPTILSGELGDPTDSTDNTGLVVFVNSVIDSVHIDGFVIRDGSNTKGGGIHVNAEGGAGMSVVYSNTGIYNCRFINNSGSLFGGGLSLGTYSNATVSNCVFSGNTANNRGGALYSKNNLQLTNCVFENNHTAVHGGAVAVEGRLNISNTVFYRNYTTFNTKAGLGGALYLTNAGGVLNNCTFVENKATAPYYYYGGGGLYLDQVRNIQMKNCVFNGNSSDGSTTGNGADYNHENNMYSNQFSNSVLQYARPYLGDAGNKFTTDAGFQSLNDPKGADGRWLTKDDGFQLHYASLAVNRGVNAAIPNITTDIAGNDRIVLDTVDAGAYEYQNLPQANAGIDTIICAGNTAQLGKDGNPKHSYSWTSSPTGFTSTAVTPVVNPAVPTTYYIEVSNGMQTTYDTVQVTMSSSLTPVVSVATASTNVCANTPTAFTATPTYGGPKPSYQWQVNGANTGSDTAVFVSAVKDGDKVNVVLTSNASCASPATATSNIINMQVTPVVTPEVLLNGPTVFCLGDTVTYTATPSNGGTRPSYTWYKSGFWEAENFSNTFTVTSGISGMYVIMTSNAVCKTKAGDTSNIITVQTASKSSPSVSVSSSANAYCGTRLVTFTAQGNDAGSSPQYQWKLNGNNVGTNSTTYQSNALNNGDNVYVILTSNADCPRPPVVESNRVTMSVTKEIFPAVTITGLTEVKQDSLVTFTVSVQNANGPVTYQWYDSTTTHRWQSIPGANAASFNYAPHATGDMLRCIISTTTNCGYASVIQKDLTFKINAVTGIVEPADAYGITSWPNPVNTYMVIEGLRYSDQWQTMEITNLEGRQKILTKNIAGQTKVTLNTGQLKAGLYIALLRKKNGETVYIKFLKL